MPKPNGKNIAHGVGGGYASLNNVAFSRGGAVDWRDDHTIAFANGDNNWVVSTYDIVTKKIETVKYGGIEVGASEIYAGGGHISSWLGGESDMRGLWSTRGLRLKDAGLLGMGPDGSIAYKPSYQSRGPTRVLELDGSDWELTTGHAYQLQLLGNRRAIWWDSVTGGFKVTGISTPKLLPGTVMPHIVEMPDGELWLSCYSDAGTVLYPFGSFTGFPVVPYGKDAWSSSSVIDDHTIMVCWATGEAEQPGQVRSLYHNLVTEEEYEPVTGITISLWKKDLLQLIDVPVPPINRPLWLGFFTGRPDSGGGWSTTLSPMTLPGNCYLLIPDGVLKTKQGVTIGHFISGNTVEDIEQKANAVDHAIAYWDSRRWPRLPNLKSDAWICLQCYCGVNESPEAFETDLRNVIATIPTSKQIALVAQCYTSNNGLTANLAHLVPVFARLARDFKNTIAILPFSGYGRATGLQDHPDVVAVWQKLAASITQPIVTPEEPHMSDRPVTWATTPDQWINHEFPQLIAAYRTNPANADIIAEVPGAPFAEWGAFQAMRRFGPEQWSFARMLADVAAKEVP